MRLTAPPSLRKDYPLTAIKKIINGKRVELEERFELSTRGLQNRCSDQLSYSSNVKIVQDTIKTVKKKLLHIFIKLEVHAIKGEARRSSKGHPQSATIKGEARRSVGLAAECDYLGRKPADKHSKKSLLTTNGS